ncbi:hypothetical protein RyT2_28470 [Pseudolactococcus yaeyamensis]
MVVPFTKIWFILGLVKYRKEKKIVEEYVFAEYDFLKKELIWKQWRDEQYDTNMKIVSKILMLAPISSPLIIVPIVGFMGRYSNQIATPKERLGDYWFILPIVLAILIAISFDLYMLNIRRNAIIMDAPEEKEIRNYLRAVAYKKIGKSRENLIPYSLLLGFFTCFLIISGIVFWLYSQPDTTVTFIAKLLSLSIILAVFPLVMWWILGRALVTKKYFKN